MKRLFLSVLIVSTVLLAALPQPLKATLPTEIDGQRLPSLAPMVERVQGSLVKVLVETRIARKRDPFDDPFFKRFFDQRRATAVREASAIGVVLDAAQGLIYTNEHAVRKASMVKVVLNNGEIVEGKVIGSDPTSDVAVIKVNVDGLTAIDVADSDALRIGDFVVSIGDPLGEENTLVTGVVSSLANSSSPQVHQNFIRSDAATGPGVLVNLNGELVGLNIAKTAQTAGSLRIGFSTPANTVVRVGEQVVKYGAPQRGFLAVQVQDLTADLANAFNISQPGGVVITSVSEDSSASLIVSLPAIN